MYSSKRVHKNCMKLWLKFCEVRLISSAAEIFEFCEIRLITAVLLKYLDLFQSTMNSEKR